MTDRRYSLLIPWFMDGALALVQTAMPLLALRLGADPITLGSIGWIAQAVRLPICFTSGHLSEKLGRATIIVPAAGLIALASIGLAFAGSNLQVILYYTISLAAIGAFYPPLQAMIGDVSRRGELTKNLGAFNIGWCIGGSIAALGAGWLVRLGLSAAFYTACGGFVTAGLLVMAWRRRQTKQIRTQVEEATPAAQDTGPLLTIARMGHFMGFFGYAIVRILFPQVGKSMGWSESTIALVVAWILVGQATGMLAANASPWWRGKLWPQVGAQSLMLVSALVAWRAVSPIVLGASFFCIGLSLSTAYTAALYHGLSSRANRGRNTGIHEGIVAAGGISGSLLGGVTAQMISLRAPYIIMACLAICCLTATALLHSQFQLRVGKCES